MTPSCLRTAVVFDRSIDVVLAGRVGSSSSPEAAAEGGAAGEWPRSSRSLLHRVAALALSGTPATGIGSTDAGALCLPTFSK